MAPIFIVRAKSPFQIGNARHQGLCRSGSQARMGSYPPAMFQLVNLNTSFDLTNIFLGHLETRRIKWIPYIECAVVGVAGLDACLKRNVTSFSPYFPDDVHHLFHHHRV